MTAAKVAALIGGRAVGDVDRLVTGINEINRVGAGDLMFVDHPKYYDKALNSAATTILIDKEVPVPKGKAIIIRDEPCLDYNALVSRDMPLQPWGSNAHVIGAG